MTLSNLDNLYRQIILEHSKHPHHHGKMDDATKTFELRNPTCGDELTVYVKLDGDYIRDISFSGVGCTISKASASLMCDEVLGKRISKVKEETLLFSDMILGKINSNKLEEKLGDASVLIGVKNFPARIKCATLAWKAVYQVLEEKKHG